MPRFESAGYTNVLERYLSTTRMIVQVESEYQLKLAEQSDAGSIKQRFHMRKHLDYQIALGVLQEIENDPANLIKLNEGTTRRWTK